MGSLELIDSSLQSPNAVGIATLTHPRCRLGDDRMFFDSDPAVVVVAKRLLILHQPLSTKLIPIMVGHPTLQSDFRAAGYPPYRLEPSTAPRVGLAHPERLPSGQRAWRHSQIYRAPGRTARSFSLSKMWLVL